MKKERGREKLDPGVVQEPESQSGPQQAQADRSFS
jgi:hypothetical protein